VAGRHMIPQVIADDGPPPPSMRDAKRIVTETTVDNQEAKSYNGSSWELLQSYWKRWYIAKSSSLENCSLLIRVCRLDSYRFRQANRVIRFDSSIVLCDVYTAWSVIV